MPDSTPPENGVEEDGRDTAASPNVEEDTDCSDEDAPAMDWLAMGTYEAGWQTFAGTSIRSGVGFDRLTAVYYPATENGENTPTASNNTGFPVIFFEHAGGSHYLNYDVMFSFLASHGLVVVSIDHVGVDDAGLGWGTANWWAAHDVLFTDTIAEFQTWNQTDGHPFHGLMDFERLGLAGHSHGSALLSMQNYAPVSPFAGIDVRGIALLAPCPDVDMSTYIDVYASMAPLQVIYGSRDQDGCVAYGQSIAVYEAGGQPSHFIHLPGASHYGFTDEGAMLDATISRQDHQATAAAGWLAWWKLILEDDMRALPYLRGDRSLLPDGPEIHTQYRERDPVVVDRFAAPSDGETVVEERSAIVGIDGQTFINGFLSDTFADTDAGVGLVRQQMEHLLEGVAVPASVLFYIDRALGTDVYALALAELVSEGQIDLVQSVSGDDFTAQIEAGSWDLIVAATQDGSASDEHSYDVAMASWICGGGKAIVSDYRVDSASAASVLACSETAFSSIYNFEEIHGDGALFGGSISLVNPGWGYFAVGLEDAGATRFAHTEIETVVADGLATNSLGYAPSHSGVDEVFSEWMLNDSRGVYHPNWAVTVGWSSPGGFYRQTLGDDLGLDVTGQEVLSFRIMQRHDDARNSDAVQDLSLHLTDNRGITASVLLSTASQGPLRPNPDVGAGTTAKSVYETYRIPVAAFVDAAPDLNVANVRHIDWVFDRTDSGLVTIDDVVFTRAGLCD